MAVALLGLSGIPFVSLPSAQANEAVQSLPISPGGVWVVTQTEFVQRVLVLNASSGAARLQADAAFELLRAEQALYDPVFLSGLRYESLERPRTYDETTLGSLANQAKPLSIEKAATATVGLRGRLPTGATVELSQELRQRSSNLLASQSDREYRGTLNLTLRQPLLRRAGRDMTEADLRVADLEQQIERQRFLKQALDLVGEAAAVYRQLYRAEQSLHLRRQSLELAQQLQQELQRRVAGGFAPRADLLEAELAVGVRQTELARAAQQFQEVQIRARNLLSLSPQAQPALRLELDSVSPEAATVGRELADGPPAKMFDRWPAYRIAQLRMDQERIRLDYATNLMRPDLGVEIGFSGNGLRSNQVSGALDDMLWQRHPGWRVGGVLEMPLDNGEARARRQAQALRVQAAVLQLKSESVTLGNEWATRHGQWVSVLEERLQLQRELAGRQALLQAERESYELGRVRLRSLIEAQDRLADSRMRLLDASVRVDLAVLALQAVAGDLFERFDVKIEP